MLRRPIGNASTNELPLHTWTRKAHHYRHHPYAPEQRVIEDGASAVQAQRVLADRRGAAGRLLVVVLEHLTTGRREGPGSKDEKETGHDERAAGHQQRKRVTLHHRCCREYAVPSMSQRGKGLTLPKTAWDHDHAPWSEPGHGHHPA